jgi:hypothetical protein
VPKISGVCVGELAWDLVDAPLFDEPCSPIFILVLDLDCVLDLLLKQLRQLCSTVL